jgi:hypothetical protein
VLALTLATATVAGLLFLLAPMLPLPKNPERLRHEQSQMEMSKLTSAIKSYRETYGTLPPGGNDTVTNRAGDILYNTNGQQRCILALIGHNPQAIHFLDEMVSNKNHTGSIGPDKIFRDPWGNPYIIEILGTNHDVAVRTAAR